MHYSSSNNSFFPDSLRAEYERCGVWPNDAVKVTKGEFATYGQGEPPTDHQRGADENGHPTWVPIPPPNLDDLAAFQRRAIDSARDEAFATGTPYTFPGDQDDYIQVRPEDKSNLLAIAMEARDLKAAGESEPVIEFRAASNITYQLTPNQAIDMTNAAMTHVKAIYEKSWQLKDAVETALDAGDRQAIEAIIWS